MRLCHFRRLTQLQTATHKALFFQNYWFPVNCNILGPYQYCYNYASQTVHKDRQICEVCKREALCVLK